MLFGATIDRKSTGTNSVVSLRKKTTPGEAPGDAKHITSPLSQPLIILGCHPQEEVQVILKNLND